MGSQPIGLEPIFISLRLNGELVMIPSSFSEIPNWATEPYGRGTALVRRFEFATFEDAMRFMSAAVPRISDMDHHPDWQNVWRYVTVRLTTHDAGDFPTERDTALAHYLERLFADF